LIRLMDTCRKSGYDNVGIAKSKPGVVSPK